MKKEIVFAWIWIALGVIAGALGAHALKKILSFEALESFKTGVLYQLLAGTWIVVLNQKKESKSFSISSSRLILLGSVLFSLSIYALVLFPLINLSVSALGPITPIGGLIMITGLLKAAFEFNQQR